VSFLHISNVCCDAQNLLNINANNKEKKMTFLLEILGTGLFITWMFGCFVFLMNKDEIYSLMKECEKK
jgi:amino acid permease